VELSRKYLLRDGMMELKNELQTKEQEMLTALITYCREKRNISTAKIIFRKVLAKK
jgi:hypothetical protein